MGQRSLGPAFHDTFAAGVSYFGVTDLARLAEFIHKFEFHYLDQINGTYSDAVDTYETRSPIHHASGIDFRCSSFQEDDQVVPLSQAEEMVEALEASGVIHYLLAVENGHRGFCRTEPRKRTREAELAFYSEVFGFEPTDNLLVLNLSTDGGA